MFLTTIDGDAGVVAERQAGQALGRLADGADHGVALGALVEERDGGEVEVADLARRLEGGGVDVLGGERAVEARQRGEEALVLVLGALDGGEDALGLDAAQHLLGGAPARAALRAR